MAASRFLVHSRGKGKSKGKILRITGHEGPERDQRYSSTLPSTLTLDGVGGQRHAPAALPRERPGTHCTGGWVGPMAGLDGREKSRPFHRDSIPGPSSPQRVAIPTELTGLLHSRGITVNCSLLIVSKFHPRTGYKDPKEEQGYVRTLSLNSVLDGGMWSTPRLGRFTSGKHARYVEGWVGPKSGLDGRVKSRPHTSIRSPDRPAPQRIAIPTEPSSLELLIKRSIVRDLTLRRRTKFTTGKAIFRRYSRDLSQPY